MPNKCECGCGNIVTNRFVWGHNRRFASAEKNGNWKGGRVIKRGYFLIFMPGHPHREKHGYIYESRMIAEKTIGKILPLSAIFHHIDCAKGQINSNGIIVCQNRAYHRLLHKRINAYKASGHANWLKCPYCRKHDDPQNMRMKNLASGYLVGIHNECQNAYRKQKRAQT